MLRIMKLKLREGRRLGKISSSMFDREEGASRQGLFLKDLRNQRRWTQSHISFNLPVLYLSSWYWNLSDGTNWSWGRRKVKVTAGWSQALSGQGQPWPPRARWGLSWTTLAPIWSMARSSRRCRPAFVRQKALMRLVEVEVECMEVGKQFRRHNCSGSESYCQQEYTTHRLVALKVTKGKSVELAIDDFHFPSCCSCHLRLWSTPPIHLTILNC